MTHSSISRTIVIVVALAALCSIADAQPGPDLKFRRIESNWPTIELYFTASCDSQAVLNLSEQNFEVREDGRAIGNFTLHCPDPNDTCDVSVALVFDASGSMGGAGNAGAIAGGNAFIDKMDGTVDNAAIIWFTSVVTVRLGTTVNQTALHDAINSLPASGATAVWDGIYTGLQEVINNATNPCRAVVAITDGQDNSSSKTPTDIISLATRNGIRVFTIGLGGVAPTQLASIATLTGGKYYHAPGASVLVDYYEEIYDLIAAGAPECYISYQAQCADGSDREVVLTVKDFCNGSDVNTLTYRADLDVSTHTPLPIKGGIARTLPGETVNIPVYAQSSEVFLFGTFTANFSYDPDVCSFVDISSSGAYLEGIPFTLSSSPGEVSVSFLERRVFANSLTQPLFYLQFTAKQLPLTKYASTIGIHSWDFHSGCMRAELSDGLLEIGTGTPPIVLYQGPIFACEGDSVRLRVSTPGATILWSTGDTTEVIYATQSAKYWYLSTYGKGPTIPSDTITVTLAPQPHPQVLPIGQDWFCEGDEAQLTVSGDYAAIRWSTGDTSRTITVTEGGEYYVEARTSYGCTAVSPPFTLTKRPAPEPDIAGAAVVCDILSLHNYSVALTHGHDYFWSVSGGTIVGPANQNTVQIHWNDAGNYQISVTQTNTGNSCSGSDIMSVLVGNIQPEMNKSGEVFLCPGERITLFLLNSFDSYKWSNGLTTKGIDIAAAGTYWCTVKHDSCRATTDTVRVRMFDSTLVDIEGEAIVCEGDETQYTIVKMPGATYAWLVEGGTLLSAQNADTILVRWSSTSASGRLRLQVSRGGCTFEKEFPVLKHQPAPPELILYGDTVVCKGDTLLIEAEEGFTNYLWSTQLPGRFLEVTQSGTYNVTAISPEGCLVRSRSVFIYVVPGPSTPVITRIGDELHCNVVAPSYQWYKDGVAIPGATTKNIPVQGRGNYTVFVVDSHGCTNESDPYAITGTGTLDNGLARSCTITPNPSNGVFSVELEFETPTAFDIRIVDIAGREVYTKRVSNNVVTYRDQISLTGVQSGVYFLLVESGDRFDRMKFVVQSR